MTGGRPVLLKTNTHTQKPLKAKCYFYVFWKAKIWTPLTGKQDFRLPVLTKRKSSSFPPQLTKDQFAILFTIMVINQPYKIYFYYLYVHIDIYTSLYFYISDTYTSERESNRAIRNEHLFNSLFLMSSSSLLMLQQSLQELTQVRNRFTKTFSAQFISSNHYTHNCSLPVTHTLQEHCAQLSSSLVLLGSQIQINYSVAASATLGEKKKKL